MQENLKLSSNHVATLTPFLESNGRTKILPSIVVYGRKREIVNRRKNITPTPESIYSTIRRKHNKEQIVNYRQQFQFEAWMRDAEMKLNFTPADTAVHFLYHPTGRSREAPCHRRKCLP